MEFEFVGKPNSPENIDSFYDFQKPFSDKVMSGEITKEGYWEITTPWHRAWNRHYFSSGAVK